MWGWGSWVIKVRVRVRVRVGVRVGVLESSSVNRLFSVPIIGSIAFYN